MIAPLEGSVACKPQPKSNPAIQAGIRQERDRLKPMLDGNDAVVKYQAKLELIQLQLRCTHPNAQGFICGDCNFPMKVVG